MKNLLIIIVALLGFASCSKENTCPVGYVSSINERIEVVLNDNHTIHLPPNTTYNFGMCDVSKIVVRSKEPKFTVKINGGILYLEGLEDIDITEFKKLGR